MSDFWNDLLGALAMAKWEVVATVIFASVLWGGIVFCAGGGKSHE